MLDMKLQKVQLLTQQLVETNLNLPAPDSAERFQNKTTNNLIINQINSIMKKLIYCAAALAAMIFAGSCQQENLEPVAQENTVTYTVELPDVQTKAIGDAATVDELIYEVWKTETANVRNLTDPAAKATRLYQDRTALVQRNGKTCAVVTFNLVQDQEYTILFWAQKAGTDVYDTDELTDVHYKSGCEPGSSNYSSNQENYAAFYAAEFVSDVDSKSRNVTLKRPFAQLNIATKNTVKDYTVAMNTSKVTISNVATHFDVAMNLPTETAVSVPASFEFKTADVPTDPAQITVNGQVYDYVAMNYVFAMGPNVTVDYEINTTLTAKNLDGTDGTTTTAQIKHTVPNVPLKENYRTNIVGNLLSSTTEYYIEIDDNWYDEPGDGTEVEVWDGLYAQEPPQVNGVYQISLASELAWLAKAVNGTLVERGANVTKSTGYVPANSFAGKTFVLTQDIDLSHDVDLEGNVIDHGPALWTPIGVRGNKPFEGTFDGKGFTIKNLYVDMDQIVENQRNIQSDLIIKANDGAGLFGSCKTATVKNVTIKNATVKGHYKAAAVVADANCTVVENCHVEDATIISTPYNKDDANNAGAIVGYLAGEAAWAKVTDCSVKNSDVTAYRDVAAVVGRTNQKTQVLRNTVTNVEVVADQTPAYKEKKVGNAGKVIGYDVTNNCVMEGNVVDEATTAVVKVNTAPNLEYQINNAAADVVVVLASDISGDITVDQQENKNVVIDGNGKKYDGTITIDGNSRNDGAETLLIKNVKFETERTDVYFLEMNSTDGELRYAHNVTVDNCTFKGNETTVGARFRQCYNIAFTNCEVLAGHSLAQLYGCSGVTVENVKINAKSGISFGTSTGISLSDSEIISNGLYGYGVRVDADGERTATISNTLINAGAPVLMRKAKEAYTMNLTNNTLKTTEIFHVIVTGSDYDEGTTLTAPAEGYQLNGADGYVVFPNSDFTVVSNASDLTEAVKKGGEIRLLPTTFEGTFAIKKPVNIIGLDASTIKGRVNVSYTDKVFFTNIKFRINDASKHKNTFSGAPYKYPGIVVGYSAAMTFEGCDFETSISNGVCGINSGNHSDGSDILTVNNCSFKGDFYAIRARTLFSITNNTFDIYTSQGTLAAVFTWGNQNSGADRVTFTGNTNVNTNKVYGVQLTSNTHPYDGITFNVQNNKNFLNLQAGTSTGAVYSNMTFANGSETFGVPVTTETLASTIASGESSVYLTAGNYTLPSVSNGEVTISGSSDAVLTITTPNYTGSDVTFEGVTIKGSGYGTGVQHVNTVTYNDVTIIGEMCLYGEKVVFNNVTFELNNQYIWTYGAKEVEFNGCTFNTNGKAILVYNEGAGANKVTVNGCTFNATAGAKAGAIANQNCAAIEIDNFQSSGVGTAHTVVTSNNKYSEYFSGEWRIKNFVAGNPVTVNGKEYNQIAVDGKLMTIDADKNVTVL